MAKKNDLELQADALLAAAEAAEKEAAAKPSKKSKKQRRLPQNLPAA